MKRKTLGDMGEELAKAHLKKKGYKLIEANYRCHPGEIDIVARQNDCLVFVEVRTRSTLEYGTPEESLSHTKRQHMIKSAYHYLQNHQKLPENWRLDLVAVELDTDNKLKRIEILENILEE